MNEYIILYIYMYLLLIYIILAFFLLICYNNIEGNTLGTTTTATTNIDIPGDITLNFVYKIASDESNDKKEFSLNLPTNVIIKNLLPQIYEQNKSIDIDLMRLNYKGIIFNNNNTLEYYIKLISNIDINKLDNNSIINVNSVLISDIDLEYKDIYEQKPTDVNDIEKRYKKYYNSIKKFTNINKHIDKIKYNDDLLKLFDNKSKPVLNPYNGDIYIDDNKDKNNIPGYIPEDLTDRIVNGDIKYNNNNKYDKCCTKSRINIENNLLVNDNKSYTIFEDPKYYENSKSSLYIGINDYNNDYINYMNEGQNKYKYLDTPVLLRSGTISVG